MSFNTTLLHLFSLSPNSRSPLLSGDKNFNLNKCFFSRHFAPIILTTNGLKVKSTMFSKILDSAVIADAKKYEGNVRVEILFSKKGKPIEILDSTFKEISGDHSVVSVFTQQQTILERCNFFNCKSEKSPTIDIDVALFTCSHLCVSSCEANSHVIVCQSNKSIINLATFVTTGPIIESPSRHSYIRCVNTTDNYKSSPIIHIPKFQRIGLSEIIGVLTGDNDLFLDIERGRETQIRHINMIKEKGKDANFIQVIQGMVRVIDSHIINKVNDDSSLCDSGSLTFIRCTFNKKPEYKAENIKLIDCIYDIESVDNIEFLNTMMCNSKFTGEEKAKVDVSLTDGLIFGDSLSKNVQNGILFLISATVAGIVMCVIYINLPQVIKEKKKEKILATQFHSQKL